MEQSTLTILASFGLSSHLLQLLLDSSTVFALRLLISQTVGKKSDLIYLFPILIYWPCFTKKKWLASLLTIIMILYPWNNSIKTCFFFLHPQDFHTYPVWKFSCSDLVCEHEKSRYSLHRHNFPVACLFFTVQLSKLSTTTL